MIEPGATDVLRSLTTCFEELIRPAPTGTAERSAGATMSGLMRHLRLRLDREADIAAADMTRQAPLLEPLEMATPPVRANPLAFAVASQAAIEALLVRLIAAREAHGGTDLYRALRAALREEMAAQFQAEAALIEPAFVGSGPRR